MAATSGVEAIVEPHAAVTPRELVERYWDRTHRFAAMITRNDQDAADVAQEAMERVIRNLDRYSPSRGAF